MAKQPPVYRGGSYPVPRKKRPPKPGKPPATRGPAGGGSSGLTVEEQARREADAYIAMLQQQIQLEQDAYQKEVERQAQLERDRAAALARAIQSMGLPQAISNIFGSAAQSQAGLASGFSQEIQGQANQQAAEMNNMLSGTGQEAMNQGANIGDVLYGVGGFIPAQTLGTSGTAFAANAAMQPAFALEQGIQSSRKVYSDAQAEIDKYIAQKAQARAQYPTVYQEALTRAQTTRTNLKNEAMSLYQAGLITQRELGRRLGLPNWKKMPNTLYGAGGTTPTVRQVGGYLYQYDPKSGKWVPVAGEGSAPRIYQQGGYFWTIDPKTGKLVKIGGSGPQPGSGKGYQLKTLPDGSVAIFDPNTGQLYPVKGAPQKPKKPATVGQKKRAGQIARESAEGIDVVTYKPDPANPNRQIPVHQKIGRSYQEAVRMMRAEGIPDAAIYAALNQYWNPAKAKRPGFGNQNPRGLQIKYVPMQLPNGKTLAIPYVAYDWEPAAEGRPLWTPTQFRAAYAKAMAGYSGSKKGGRESVSYTGTLGTVVSSAISQLGKPYVFGSGPDTSSFDCSDLIQWAYAQAGINLPRTTFQQIKRGRRIRNIKDIQPGDLVFSSPHHVVLYIGNGMVIAAPHTGEVVQYQPLSAFTIYQIRRVLPEGSWV